MADAVVPPFLIARGAAVVRRACASRIHVNPACVAKPAASKKPKRPGSFRDGDPPTKRRRAREDGDAAPVMRAAMSFEEREGVADLLLSLVQPGAGNPGSCSDQTMPIIHFLEQNKTSGSRLGNEIEIDVHALGDDALYGIRSRISAYAQKRELRDGAISARKNHVTQKSPRPENRAKPQPSASRETTSELLTKVRPSTEAIRRRDIERRRAEAQREVEQMVPTVEFNDAFIDWQDVTRSRRELVEAREEAGRAQVLAMVGPAADAIRRRDIERRRTEARREVEQMVRTVEFNDPSIDWQDVLK